METRPMFGYGSGFSRMRDGDYANTVALLLWDIGAKMLMSRFYEDTLSISQVKDNLFILGP